MSTISTSPPPALQLRLPRPGAARRFLVPLLVAVLVAAGFGMTTPTSPLLSAVHLEVATHSLSRAAAAGNSAAGQDRGATQAALRDRASCWRQAHRLGQDPSSCASATGRETSR